MSEIQLQEEIIDALFEAIDALFEAIISWDNKWLWNSRERFELLQITLNVVKILSLCKRMYVNGRM